MAYVGERSHEGVYERCDACGDSPKNPNHAHKLVYFDGHAHCFRCGQHWSTVDYDSWLNTFAEGEPDVFFDGTRVELYDWKALERHPIISHRPTVLSTVNSYYADYIAFPMRTPSGRLTGYHNRELGGKKFYTEGDRSLGFVGDKLVSSPSRPLTVVEGPYDCIDTGYVSVFGMLYKGILSKFFKLQYVWLWPDPDVVNTLEKRQQFERMTVELVRDDLVFVQGYILSNADPDEATVVSHTSLGEYSYE